ncbi:UNVERIFIED_CONTAM: hypothetical protein Slati_4577500 [Sesamum latifolium]|uniref:Uncharacterized protein n=1 Tax=Sesamum latifolium TaxID=2727402 RepID=A0AAW2SFE6_9LAMI
MCFGSSSIPASTLVECTGQAQAQAGVAHTGQPMYHSRDQRSRKEGRGRSSRSRSKTKAHPSLQATESD